MPILLLLNLLVSCISSCDARHSFVTTTLHTIRAASKFIFANKCFLNLSRELLIVVLFGLCCGAVRVMFTNCNINWRVRIRFAAGAFIFANNVSWNVSRELLIVVLFGLYLVHRRVLCAIYCENYCLFSHICRAAGKFIFTDNCFLNLSRDLSIVVLLGLFVVSFVRCSPFIVTTTRVFAYMSCSM